MVILASKCVASCMRWRLRQSADRHRSYNGDTRTPSISSERETYSVNTPLATKLDEGSFLPNHLRGEMAPDTRRNLYLSLTLTSWTPLPPQGLWLQDTTVGRNGLLTPNTSGSRSRLITSASPAASAPARPLTALETEIRGDSLKERQHATDHFPRFAYLLRHGTPLPDHQTDDRQGTVQPGSQLDVDDRCSRHSADPQSASGRAHASVATIPDARTQCGVCDETGLQSCAAASASGTLSPFSPSALSSPSRATTSASVTPSVLSEPPAFESALKDRQRSDSPSCTVSMSSYHSASTSSRGGSRTEQLLAHTRKGAHCITGERITGETPHSFASSQNQSHSPVSPQPEDVDEDEDQPDSPPGSGPQVTAEGQPKKKKTRRAGVNITRVRRMQREVRRLAEEGEANAPRQPQPVRVRLRMLYIAHWTTHADVVCLFSDAVSPPRGPGLTRLAHQSHRDEPYCSPIPGSAVYRWNEPSSARAHEPCRVPRTHFDRASATLRDSSGCSDCAPTWAPIRPHPRGTLFQPACFYLILSEWADRVCVPPAACVPQDGDDVVLLRLPGVGRAPPAGSSIWTYRPEERPRGGSV